MKYPTLTVTSTLLLFIMVAEGFDQIVFPKRHPFGMYSLGESCETFNGKEGQCVKREKCSKFDALMAYWNARGLENFIPSYSEGFPKVYKRARSDCGFHGREVLICCDDSLSYQDWIKIIPVKNVITIPNVKNEKEKINEIDDDDDEAYFKDSDEE